MRIETTRFGTVEVGEGRSIRFPEGLPGFPEAHEFLLLEHSPESPFHWLQNIEDPSLAFVVMDPLLVEARYLESIPPQALVGLGLERARDAAILSIVTIDRDNCRVTVNLMAPLVIHPGTRQGRQVILMESAYTTKHEIVSWGPHSTGATGQSPSEISCRVASSA